MNAVVHGRHRPWIRAICVAVTLVAGALAFQRFYAPDRFEAAFLRWVRILAWHPLRSTLGLSLLIWALGPLRPAVRDGLDDPRNESGGP